MVFASRQFHRDPKFTNILWTCKNHAPVTLRYRSGQASTATDQTAGPLGVIVRRPDTTDKLLDIPPRQKIIANKFVQLKGCVYICNLKVA
jgi:hypothetical protein